MGVYEKFKALYTDSNYRSGLGYMTVGEKAKIQSDNTMNDTWWNDPASQVAYLYDYYHDDHKTQLKNLNSKNDPKKIPIDIKFIISTHQSYDKDVVTRHIQLRPHQQCNVNYYGELFENAYSAIFPVGLYIDIIDAEGRYNKWLVVRISDYYDPQFPKYDVLPCDHVFQYVYKGKKFSISGVRRSQNSYNPNICSCCDMWKHIYENSAKSVNISMRKHRGNHIDCVRLYDTVEHRS